MLQSSLAWKVPETDGHKGGPQGLWSRALHAARHIPWQPYARGPPHHAWWRASAAPGASSRIVRGCPPLSASRPACSRCAPCAPAPVGCAPSARRASAWPAHKRGINASMTASVCVYVCVHVCARVVCMHGMCVCARARTCEQSSMRARTRAPVQFYLQRTALLLSGTKLVMHGPLRRQWHTCSNACSLHTRCALGLEHATRARHERTRACTPAHLDLTQPASVPALA